MTMMMAMMMVIMMMIWERHFDTDGGTGTPTPSDLTPTHHDRGESGRCLSAHGTATFEANGCSLD